MECKAVIFKSRLPKEFQEVEYIGCSGTQYINSGCIPNQNTKVDVSFSFDQSNLSIVGGSNSASYRFQLFLTATRCVGYRVFGSNYIYFSTPTLVAGRKYNVVFDVKNLECYLDNVLLGSLTSSYTTPITYPMFIGANNIGGTAGTQLSGNIYKCDIYDNDVLIREFVPCYRIADNVIGLYDLVNGVFYANAGSGVFTKGDNVTNLVPVEVEPQIFNTSTQAPMKVTISIVEPILSE